MINGACFFFCRSACSTIAESGIESIIPVPNSEVVFRSVSRTCKPSERNVPLADSNGLRRIAGSGTRNDDGWSVYNSDQRSTRAFGKRFAIQC